MRTIKGILLGLALLLAISAFASNKGSFFVPENVRVGSQTLKPGDYSLKWDGNGPDIELNILKDGKVVATTPAHMVDANRPFDSDAAIINTNADGSKSLIGVELAGKKFTIEIGQETSQAVVK